MGAFIQDIVNAFLLAVVEGITEFLPISSTGHMIVLENYLALGNDDEFAHLFMIVIQLPAILSVMVYFWNQLWPFHKDVEAFQTIVVWVKVGFAFLPAVVLGLLFDDFIEETGK